MIYSAKWSYIFYFEIILFIVYVNSQQSKYRLRCESILNCGACLQQPGCVWCLNPKQNTSVVHDRNAILSNCILEGAVDIICSSADLKKSETKGEILQDQPFKSETGNIVQMKPQRIRLYLKIGQSYDLQFQYRQAENYPVDLYYIIDNSYSMRHHKEKLATLGTKLTEKMRKITNDFTIGFGSFVDKVVLPFESTEPRKYKAPCTGSKECVPPYSFKNHMRLSTEFEEFSRQVRKAKSSGSLDHPEGGFDAIMQAIVCKKEIGWRPQARHLMLFSTDADFHIAGDGKLGGIIQMNDAKCHMINNSYDGLFNDYPSVSQLNYIAKENFVNLIFAVPKIQAYAAESYRLLSKEIENSKADILDNDSENVIKLVVDNYKKILSSTTLESNATKNIEVQITSHCKHPLPDGCDKVKLGEVVNFTATFKLLKCEDNMEEPIIVSLKPEALNETLIIEVYPLCKCDCESPEYRKENSTECSKGQGDLVCGICRCHKDRHGRKCECDNKYDATSNSSSCKETPEAKECSGLGTCICGQCHCNRNINTGKEYSGPYCECDDDSCERENGILCGGRGTCDCGKCICNAGWKGSSCSCLENNKTCIRDGHTEVCSGNGTCSCGKCECENHFTGAYCEVCPTCEGLCPVIINCVECTVFKTGIYNREECKLKCVAYNIKAVEGDIVDHENENEKICRATVNKCEIIYKYEYDNLENLIITVRKEQNCEPNPLVWVLSVIASVILLGIFTLLIWKIITTLHDKREYQKFYTEQKESKWHRNDNPLYKDATTTFENPYYPH